MADLTFYLQMTVIYMTIFTVAFFIAMGGIYLLVVALKKDFEEIRKFIIAIFGGAAGGFVVLVAQEVMMKETKTIVDYGFFLAKVIFIIGFFSLLSTFFIIKEKKK
jgi:hypothetical protein